MLSRQDTAKIVQQKANEKEGCYLLSRHLCPLQAVKRHAAVEAKVTQGANRLKHMTKAIDNSKVLATLTSRTACQGAPRHCQNQKKLFSWLSFYRFSFFSFPHFSLCLFFNSTWREDSSRELENTPRQKRAEFGRFAWLECQGRVVEQVWVLRVQCLCSVLVPFCFFFFSISGSVDINGC